VRRCSRLTLLVTVAMLACAGPTREDFARIEPGLTTRTEVARLLGEPTISTPTESVYLAKDGRQAVVWFDDSGRVTRADWWPTPRPSPAAREGDGSEPE